MTEWNPQYTDWYFISWRQMILRKPSKTLHPNWLKETVWRLTFTFIFFKIIPFTSKHLKFSVWTLKIYLKHRSPQKVSAWMSRDLSTNNLLFCQSYPFPWLFSAGYTILLPKQSKYDIFTYIYHNCKPNVGNYTLHGRYGWVSAVGPELNNSKSPCLFSSFCPNLFQQIKDKVQYNMI